MMEGKDKRIGGVINRPVDKSVAEFLGVENVLADEVVDYDDEVVRIDSGTSGECR